MSSIRRLRNIIEVLRQLVARNGLVWFFLFIVRHMTQRAFEVTSRRLRGFEEKKGLPGFYDAEMQRIIWNAYDWGRQGNEWTPSEEFKGAVVEGLIIPQIAAGGDVLEIGPGAGRWTSILQEIARRLTLVDVSQSCIDACKAKFGHLPHVDFFVGDGRSLAFCPDSAVDSIWSFDVFVHISAADTRSYFAEFARVLRPGGRAVIHHPGVGGTRGGFRSDTTTDIVQRLAEENGLVVKSQFDTWKVGERTYDLRWYGDMISILEKP